MKFPIILMVALHFGLGSSQGQRRKQQQESQDINIGAVFEADDKDDIKRIFRYATQNYVKLSAKWLNLTAPIEYRLQSRIINLKNYNSYQATREVCKIIKNGVGIFIGPKSPDIAPYVASVLGALKIPHILTGIDTYPAILEHSINIYPHWITIATVVRDLIKYNKWKIFTFIYEEEDALLRMRILLEAATENKWKFVLQDLKQGYRKVLQRLKRNAVTNIVLDCKIENIRKILKEAHSIGLITDYHNYIITNLDFHTIRLDEFQHLQTNITGFRIVRSDSKYTQELLREWTKGYNRIERMKISRRIKLTTEMALMFDAVRLFNVALSKVDVNHNTVSSSGRSCENETIWEYGAVITQALRSTTIYGITGKIDVREGYRKRFDVEIVKMKRKGILKLGTWTPERGVLIFQPHEPSLADIYNSMRSRIFKVTTILNSPYAMLKKSWRQLQGNDRYEGYCIDLINEIASKLKFQFEIHIVPDHVPGSRDPATGNWNGMIAELINGTADMAMGDLTITHERNQAVDFTMPFMTLGISILFKKPSKSQPSLFSFLSPLALKVWLYMLTAYVGVSVLLVILSRFSPYEWVNPHPCNPDSDLRENQFGIANSFWFTAGSLLMQGTDFMPKAWSTRMLAGTWWFFTLIMISSYTANLAAFLTSKRMSSPIESAEDLARQTKFKYGCFKGGSTENFFRKSKLATFKRMWAFMESASPSVFTKNSNEGIERVLNGNYAYLMEATSIEYITERYCDLTQIGGLLDSKGYGIATPQGSPYRQLISSAILQLQEETRLDSLKLKWWKEERGGGKCSSEVGQSKMASAELSFSNVGGVFVVLIAGIAISCVIAMVEFIWQTHKIDENERYSMCTEMCEELKVVFRCMGTTKPAKREPRKLKKKEPQAKQKIPHPQPDRIPRR